MRILCRMVVWLVLILRLAAASSKSRGNLLLENLALRHQLLVLHRTAVLARLTTATNFQSPAARSSFDSVTAATKPS